ncbi:MAG: hypothetical protein IKD04_04050 [Clostridia bacterium]|nr:hypothetical protein [Clostridia bacterium]
MEYTMFDKPIRVYGIYNFDKTHKNQRLTPELRKELDLEYLGRRTPGARIAFRTNSEKVRITVRLASLSPDIGISIYGCQSAKVYVGKGNKACYRLLISPKSYTEKEFSGSFTKCGELEDIMIFLPRNEPIENVIIELQDGAQILPPTPYKYEKPILFFGSSITEGGCCTTVTNAYTALLSQWLDCDYYNYGFSGSCRGQLQLAELFSDMDISAFVLDYDHNAPTADFLEKTHRPFFELVRERKPNLPILMLTAPNYEYMSEADKRREIIRNTYETALAKGDKNVYFLDGKDLFGEENRECCTVDRIHPNDLGFYRMAKKIYPTLKQILEKE